MKTSLRMALPALLAGLCLVCTSSQARAFDLLDELLNLGGGVMQKSDGCCESKSSCCRSRGCRRSSCCNSGCAGKGAVQNGGGKMLGAVQNGGGKVGAAQNGGKVGAAQRGGKVGAAQRGCGGCDGKGASQKSCGRCGGCSGMSKGASQKSCGGCRRSSCSCGSSKGYSAKGGDCCSSKSFSLPTISMPRLFSRSCCDCCDGGKGGSVKGGHVAPSPAQVGPKPVVKQSA
ncbi:MAG: hypothetical protein QGG36_07790 [Pirellulaceae bacterium]|nr:hypothetical protein [Pirellulaceae bacterium]MDP7015686.1 hypothetical protein [Pirellulaceae bacterium]